MGKMIEKLARALWASESGDEKSWDDLDVITKSAFCRDVRAILQALLTPDEGMIAAGIIERHDSGVPEAWSLATANIFTAMIQHVLDEQG